MGRSRKNKVGFPWDQFSSLILALGYWQNTLLCSPSPFGFIKQETRGACTKIGVLLFANAPLALLYCSFKRFLGTKENCILQNSRCGDRCLLSSWPSSVKNFRRIEGTMHFPKEERGEKIKRTNEEAKWRVILIKCINRRTRKRPLRSAFCDI